MHCFNGWYPSHQARFEIIIEKRARDDAACTVHVRYYTCSKYQEKAVDNEVNMESWKSVTRVAVVPHEDLDLHCT